MKRCAYAAAECIDCIVRPCVQNPWYCLHSPINVFCMVWSCCHGDPRIGRLKRGDVCMEGVREKEKGAPLACLLTDWLTPEHGTLCVYAYWYAPIVILLNLLSCHISQLSPFFFFFLSFRVIMCGIVCPSPRVIASAPILHLLSGNLPVMLVHACCSDAGCAVQVLQEKHYWFFAGSWHKRKRARNHRIIWSIRTKTISRCTGIEQNISITESKLWLSFIFFLAFVICTNMPLLTDI